MSKVSSLSGCISLVLLFVSCSPVVDSTPDDVTPVTRPPLSVLGNQLFANGAPVRLRGASVEEITQLATRDYGSIFESLADAGANAVRIMVNSATWNTHENHTSWAKSLRGVIDSALERCLYVILDYHVIGWPDGDSQRTDWYPTESSLALRFWDRIGQSFRDRRILFELWNEPTTGGSSSKAADWAQLKAFYMQLTSQIRARGAMNVILVGGLDSASSLIEIASSPLSDTNTGYTWHIYPNADAQGNGGNYSTWMRDLAGLSARSPVVVTEWGFDPRATASQHPELRGTATAFGAFFRDRVVDSLGLSALCWGWGFYPYGSVFADSNYDTKTDYGRFVTSFLAGRYSSTYWANAVVNNQNVNGAVYVFAFPGGTISGPWYRLYDGSEVGTVGLADGYYLANQAVSVGSSTSWANSLGLGFQVGGVLLTNRMKNPRGDEMLAFRVSEGNVYDGW